MLLVLDLVARRTQGAQKEARPKDEEGNSLARMTPKNLLAGLNEEQNQPRESDKGPTEDEEEEAGGRFSYTVSIGRLSLVRN